MHTLSAVLPLPLFDRFGGASSGSSGVRLSATEALQLSLQLDLTRLFNVRNALTIAQFLGTSPTALDYGLPDTLGLSVQSATDLQRWELVIARAIALYEPRLSQVRVVVMPDRSKPTAARVTIMAMAAMGSQMCRFDFDIALDERSASAQAHA
ncbi:type VI secretion system baseplate subunit TssE [Massilia sp. CMS3.1]|uniref:type VI secretion system baseplate subunit TssE n=1 Tax=Massilia sp. CMS3.1 TaxID=3373083 RepID=UPI003EE75C6C